jgi:HAD superfamily hydrolase (TIGR01662 family)
MLKARAVFFDVGETLIDESTEYGTWADWLGVPRHTFSAMFGAVIARGEDYRQVFQHFKPGFDLAVERQRREEAGLGERITEADLYPDARPCLQTLKDRGFIVGIAGNQTSKAEAILRSFDLPVHIIGTSATWGAEKPSVEFFEKVISATGCAPAEIVYVGDRLDNDIRPARAAGLRTVLIERGPWAYVLASDEEADRPHLRVRSLGELLGLLSLMAAQRGSEGPHHASAST